MEIFEKILFGLGIVVLAIGIMFIRNYDPPLDDAYQHDISYVMQNHKTYLLYTDETMIKSGGWYCGAALLEHPYLPPSFERSLGNWYVFFIRGDKVHVISEKQVDRMVESNTTILGIDESVDFEDCSYRNVIKFANE